MRIDFVTRRDFNFLHEIASRLGGGCTGDSLLLPENFGDGFIKRIDLEPGLKLTIHRHKLKEELIIKRNSSKERNNLITITFNTVDRPLVFLNDIPESKPINLSSIYITSTDIGLETRMPANKKIHSTIIIIHANVLLSFLEGNTGSTLIKKITAKNQSFWYQTEMTPKIQDLLFQMDDPDKDRHLSNLFYKIKIQQLIYQLFVGVLEKENRPFHSIRVDDIEKMYSIRETLLSRLDKPPTVGQLARNACMSESKMKSLFRQIFGKSIYNYYQTARMEEAARLLKDFTVGETSDKLGFINPGYFSQLFEKYHKMRPKKFRDALCSKDGPACSKDGPADEMP